MVQDVQIGQQNRSVSFGCQEVRFFDISGGSVSLRYLLVHRDNVWIKIIIIIIIIVFIIIYIYIFYFIGKNIDWRLRVAWNY